MGLGKGTHLSDIEDEEDLDEEPGEVIESAPPLEVGEEREIGNSGIKKKLLKRGLGWETPEFNDEVTIHYVGTLLDGTKFDSTRDTDSSVTIKLGQGEVVAGLDRGIITMKKGECALFTLPPELGFGVAGRDVVQPNSFVQFEVELASWITVVDVSKDGGIIKKIVGKGEKNERPGDLDEVLVKYQVALADGSIVAKTPVEGVEFCVKDGHLCPALLKAIMTMKRGEKVKLIVQPQYAFGQEGKDASSDAIHPVPPNSTLYIDLELISFKVVIDVIGDAKVFKKILKEGEGSLVANEGATVTVSYTARLEDGTVIEKKGIDDEQPLQFITDEEQVIAGLDRAVATMKKGEQAILTVNPEYGFGSIETKRDLAVVPPSSILVYEVEMLDFIKEKTPWEMNSQEKIKAAEGKKEEGNLLFKSGKYQRAGKKYDKAASYVGEDESFEDDEQKLVAALRVTCWLNGAACSLKLNDFQGAINLCSKVLDIEFHNIKALYRRAQAFIKTADLVSAEMDIKKALDVDPQNREVKLIQKKLKQLKAESNKRDAKLYSNMFAYMEKQSSALTKKLKVEKAEDEMRNGEAVAMEMENVVDSSYRPDNGKAFDSYDFDDFIEVSYGLDALVCSQLAASPSVVDFLLGFQGPLPFHLATGYVGVDEAEDVQLFYYFVKSQRNAKEDPLLLWLTGGPIDFEIVEYNGSLPTLVLNPNTWTKVATVIFVDMPVGTGFSYARNDFASQTDDLIQFYQSDQFLRKWLMDHPEFLPNPVYIGEDSYSGITLPDVVQQISNGNDEGVKPLVNLKKSCRGEYKIKDPSNAEYLRYMRAFDKCTSGIETAHILEPLCAHASPKPWMSGTIGKWQGCNYRLPHEFDISNSTKYHVYLATKVDLKVDSSRAFVAGGGQNLKVHAWQIVNA
ncbi:unnamed protein product [Dovyalis caffra]|uniref:peptidylprolyl isomerase n=1 Tax=Dovyalis caffra TaxID=77055 RepID=A0AAV1SC33_9ROSI|nr:unnamed protein product [Dovyalis caffra]